MAGEWIETTIGDQATLQRGVDITKVKQRVGTVPVISSGGVSSLHDTAAASGPGVVLGRKGVVGSVYFIPSDYWPHDTTLWVKDFHGNAPRFVYYFFKWMAPRIATMDVGSANPTLNRNHVHPIEVRWPPPDEQRAIAQILGTLDDKIELNRRMNETLEAMARALFKSWFVDFDPVRAKAEGRDSGLPQRLADLFPDSFEDSELGEIPRGWEVKSIADLANVVGGTTPSTKNSVYWDGGEHAWATPKDLSALSVPVLLDTERRITNAGMAKIGSGLLPKGTVLLSSRAPIGYLAVAEIPVAINQGFIAMTPKAGTSNLFLLFWASVAHEEIVSRANGSTFLEISKANFRPIPVAAPSAEVMRKFEQLARPLYERVVECAQESRSLAALRDALLPKLISGELRLKDLKHSMRGHGTRKAEVP
ncbi:MAG: restriction endonuclease subunit S [Gemmatimonadaceae bacterium]